MIDNINLFSTKPLKPTNTKSNGDDQLMIQLLLFMNIMGILFFFFHMLLLPIEKKFIPPKYRVFMYRINIMLFIIPLPIFLFYMRRYFDPIVSAIPVTPLVYHGPHIIVQLEQNFSFAPPILKHYEILLLLVWTIVAAVKYSRFRKKNKKNREFTNFFSLYQKEEMAKCSFDTDRLVQDALNELHMKKRPRVLLQGGVPSPNVTGVLQPTLFLPSRWDVSEEVYYMAIKHELAHIRHKDLIFQRIAAIACIINWFNPIVYILSSKMEQCDELTADATACEGATLSNLKAYENALLDFVVIYSSKQLSIKGFGSTKNSKSSTKERILTLDNVNLSKHKTAKFTTTAFLSVIMFSLSIIPALAYTLPPTIETQNLDFNSIDMVRLYLMPSENTENSSLTSMQTSESELFVLLNDVDFSESDWYCVDENGIISDYGPDTVGSHTITCNHNYLVAQLSSHTKSKDGNCYVDWYSANKCAKCGSIIKSEHIARTTYDECPH